MKRKKKKHSYQLHPSYVGSGLLALLGLPCQLFLVKINYNDYIGKSLKDLGLINEVSLKHFW